VDDEVITSQHWRVLLRAIVTDAALCTFRHEGREADLRCACKLNGRVLRKQTIRVTIHFCRGATAAKIGCETTWTDAASRTDVSIARDTVFAFQRAISEQFTQTPFLIIGLFLRGIRGVVNLRPHTSSFIHDLAHYITDGIRNLIHQCLYCPIV
jgi:hypothetical protein